MFIKPGSLDEIKKRLSLERKEVSSQEIEKRIQTAEHELAVAGEFDAVIENTEGEFDKTIFTIIDVLK